MTGEKKHSDLSSRLIKRSAKIASRSTKAPSSTAAISAPPKAATAPDKAKKEEVQRRKNPFNDMLLNKTGKESTTTTTTTTASPPASLEPESITHKRHSSSSSIQDDQAADRLVELERALALAREEQSELKEELGRVRKHSVVYRETIADYRQQLTEAYSRSPLSDTPERDTSPMEDVDHDISERHSGDHQRGDLIEQNYDLREKVAQLQEQMIEQDVLYRARLEQQITRGQTEWNELTGRLHQAEKESQERMQQLLDLKHSISALTRIESQVPDSDVATRMDELCYRIREWVISNYRRAKLNFVHLSPSTMQALEFICPKYRDIDLADRLAFYQAIVFSNLMQIFREPIWIGLPDSGPLAHIRHAAMYLLDTGTDFHEWRRTTIRALEKSHAKQELEQERNIVLQNMVAKIHRQLHELTSTVPTPAAQSSLLGILNQAADLQHMLHLQKAQYRLHLFQHAPGTQVPFDESRMEPINDSDMDDDSYLARTLTFCVFPLLVKFGDEAGENLQIQNVLLKAKVCCGVG
ncbi:hypothetical protein P154DRAFT_524462 [Amniculicola lignicola CBS 123094]|uniref:Uncharacterized protein n=1 Tax=Amniculicola lignicola CBS 123094 TaxID=1392246 RepID=A0A6A5W9X7_9PLEO|nr:hypothetical protein P154DRAFT_524462 [Amniculicola lignicola CBS 123094]